jgi:hypothetical protein
VLGVSVERDVRLREEEVARETTPQEAVQHRRADRLHPTPTRRLIETIGHQPTINETVGADAVIDSGSFLRRPDETLPATMGGSLR